MVAALEVGISKSMNSYTDIEIQKQTEDDSIYENFLFASFRLVKVLVTLNTNTPFQDRFVFYFNYRNTGQGIFGST